MGVYQRESTDFVRKRHICDTLSVLYAVLINCSEKVCYSPSRGYSLILSWLLLLSFFSFFALLGDDNLCSLLGVGGWDNHAVDWEAEVWLNGARIGVHQGGFDPFSFDVTDKPVIKFENGNTQEVDITSITIDEETSEPFVFFEFMEIASVRNTIIPPESSNTAGTFFLTKNSAI